MRRQISLLIAATLAFGVSPVGLAGCSGAEQPAQRAEKTEATPDAAEESTKPAEEAVAATGDLADGEYAIEVETDSSMFHAESCTLVVKDGAYTAILSLPGEGFSRLYYGTAEEAAAADDADVYDYYLNDDGLYTFDVPVEKLDEDLTVAAYGQRRDTWYDHTICFHAPTDDAA